MADRYLRASGNWNGPVWAATSNGAAGSAATPTASDDVIIIADDMAKFTVAVTANAQAKSVDFQSPDGVGGVLNINSGVTLSVAGAVTGFGANNSLTVTGTLSCKDFNFPNGSINISGTLRIDNPGDNEGLYVSSVTTLNATGSLLEINTQQPSGSRLWTNSKTFNDVVINLGSGGSSAVAFSIMNSPTFRSLIIQSKNSAAHTVNLGGGIFNVNKLIAIGSSASNKLTIDGDGGVMGVYESSYGQYVSLVDLEGDNGASMTPLYIGSNSTSSGSFGWLLQDPPKISTLVDPLTTAPGSNPNWTVSGSITQMSTGYGGGGYILNTGAKMMTADTYDLVDSEIVYEIPVVPPGPPPPSGGGVMFAAGDESSYIGAESGGYTSTETAARFFAYRGTISSSYMFDYLWDRPKYVRLAIRGGSAIVDWSSDGSSWANALTEPIDPQYLSLYRSVRFYNPFVMGSYEIGSINPSLAPPSTGAFLPFFIP